MKSSLIGFLSIIKLSKQEMRSLSSFSSSQVRAAWNSSKNLSELPKLAVSASNEILIKSVLAFESTSLVKSSLST